jgi:hypothetical protein
MKTNLKLLVLFFVTAGFVARAQVVPEATGPSNATATTGNRLQYAVRYSETGTFGSLSNWQTSTASGSLAFGNKNERLPFLIDYSGGYNWTLSGPAYDSGQFHRLYISQGVDSRRWKLNLTNDFSYLPQSPTTGFSGIPGIGEPIGGPSPAPPSSSQSILTLDTHALYDTAMGKVEHAVNGATAFSVGGGWSWLRFPNNDGQNTNTLLGNAQLTQRFNARNSLTAQYEFNQYTYPGATVVADPGLKLSFETNSALVGFRRDWTRNLMTTAAVGPVFITSSYTALVPNSTNIAANGSVTYKLRFASANVSYTRTINGGAGYLVGGEFSSVSGGLSKDFGLNLNVGASGGWEQTVGLSNNGATVTSGLISSGLTNATFGGVEATYHIGRNLIAFVNYNGTNQSTSSALPGNALNQLLQTVGFGIGFSPRETHRNQ